MDSPWMDIPYTAALRAQHVTTLHENLENNFTNLTAQTLQILKVPKCAANIKT